jgi:uncharacterized protein
MSVEENIERLKNIISHYSPLVVAFSGGIDSTLLTYMAHSVLSDRMIAVSVNTEFSIRKEMQFAKEFSLKHKIPHRFLNLKLMAFEEVVNNDRLRCYHCKKLIFSQITDLSKSIGFKYIADGSHASDEDDFRPGRRALEELGVISPLAEAEFTKEMIGEACSSLGINILHRYSNACLASRIPYGIRITDTVLRIIEEGENILEEMGFSPVRVRYHESIARIELSEDGVKRIILDDDIRGEIVRKIKDLGFLFVSVDLEGFRSGSLNCFFNNATNT